MRAHEQLHPGGVPEEGSFPWTLHPVPAESGTVWRLDGPVDVRTQTSLTVGELAPPTRAGAGAEANARLIGHLPELRAANSQARGLLALCRSRMGAALDGVLATAAVPAELAALRSLATTPAPWSVVRAGESLWRVVGPREVPVAEVWSSKEDAWRIAGAPQLREDLLRELAGLLALAALHLEREERSAASQLFLAADFGEAVLRTVHGLPPLSAIQRFLRWEEREHLAPASAR